jgi:hypothetical protein
LNRLPKIGKKINKSVEPDGVPVEILKLGGKAMAPFLARLMEITLNTATITSDWEKTIVAPTYKGAGG